MNKEIINLVDVVGELHLVEQLGLVQNDKFEELNELLSYFNDAEDPDKRRDRALAVAYELSRAIDRLDAVNTIVLDKVNNSMKDINKILEERK